MELVTGRAGTPHITSQQDRQRNQGTFGDGAYILKTGNQLDPVVQSSNKIQIKDGALMFQGALFSVKVGTVDEVTIANGSQGMQRKDLIVARYTYDAGENVESAAWAVIQGTPAASNPVTPEYTEGDIQAGDTTVECPVFIVTLDGINITGVEMVPEIAPDVPEIMAQLEELNSNKPSVEEVYSATGIQKNLVANQASSYVFQQTVEKAGYVYVEVNTNFPAGNNRKRIVLKKNDDTVTQSDFTCGTSGVSAWMTASAMVPVSAGDVLAAQLLCATAGMTSSDVRITGFFVNT